MSEVRPGMGQRLRDNWLELLLLLVFAAAVAWIASTARGVWQTVAVAPTATPTPAPTATPLPTQTAQVPIPSQPSTFDGQLAARQAESLVIEKEVPILSLYHYVGMFAYDTNRWSGIFPNLTDEHPLYSIRRVRRAAVNPGGSR